jgi:hypothetical protein
VTEIVDDVVGARRSEARVSAGTYMSPDLIAAPMDRHRVVDAERSAGLTDIEPLSGLSELFGLDAYAPNPTAHPELGTTNPPPKYRNPAGGMSPRHGIARKVRVRELSRSKGGHDQGWCARGPLSH